ncbi:hypothetical protein PHLCEN_2v9605 [Hermanssonia centrifuga]|uniref:Uncharacterized protein n=1 Tax=Hermanssonia centrifuga TaxID=98765 RepID=A0A2R6NQF2_9APHY|nr:hypothetical protein PHLCEN_2v9605 [Hermanssonia centrifuga]
MLKLLLLPDPFITKKVSNPEEGEQSKQTTDKDDSAARRPDLLGGNPSIPYGNTTEGGGEINYDAPSTIAMSAATAITSTFNGSRSASRPSARPLPLVSAMLPIEASGSTMSSTGDRNSVVISTGTQFPEYPDDGLRSHSGYAASFSSQPPAYAGS